MNNCSYVYGYYSPADTNCQHKIVSIKKVDASVILFGAPYDIDTKCSQ